MITQPFSFSFDRRLRASRVGGVYATSLALLLAIGCGADTAPSVDELLDSDGDGLPDAWEERGVDGNGDGVIDVDLPAMGADPLRRDVFVEVDWMAEEGAGAHSDQFSLAALEQVQKAFLAAPVQNPNGQMGILLHIDAGPDSLMDPATGAHWQTLSGANTLPHETELTLARHAELREMHMNPARLRVFRYAIAAHDLAPLPNLQCDGEYWHANGIAEGSQMIVTMSVTDGALVELGGYVPGTRDEKQQASLFMHELGHTLGLRHGGQDEINRKPNYLSVMNYSFTYRGVPTAGEDGRLDYARLDGVILDENALDEVRGLADQVPGGSERVRTIFYCGDAVDLCAENVPGLSQRTTMIADATASIDWNCNGTIGAEPVSAEINLEAPRQVLPAFADWPRLNFSAAGTIGAARTAFSSTLVSCSPGAFPDDYPVHVKPSSHSMAPKARTTLQP